MREECVFPVSFIILFIHPYITIIKLKTRDEK